MMRVNSSSERSHPQSFAGKTNIEVISTTSYISPWLSSLAYFLGHNFLMPLFFGQIRVTGQENIPRSGPVLLAPTHRSRWDALLVPYATGRMVSGRDLRFMVTSTECTGIQGWFIRRLGGFAVNAKHPSVSTLRHAMDILRQGEILVIFPEGGIRKGKLHPLKPGISRLALSAEATTPGLGVKILPIGITYSQENPSWGTDIHIQIGKPIQVRDYMQGDSKDNAKRLMSDLTQALQKLSCHGSELADHHFVKIANS